MSDLKDDKITWAKRLEWFVCKRVECSKIPFFHAIADRSIFDGHSLTILMPFYLIYRFFAALYFGMVVPPRTFWEQHRRRELKKRLNKLDIESLEFDERVLLRSLKKRLGNIE